ncbi:MAG: HAMP domain-containing protein [Myxococcota bacterium]
MRLGARIVAFILVTAVFPLLGLAVAAAGVAREQVEAAILGAQIDQAESFAALIARQLDDTERVLRLQVANFRLETAPDEARTSFLLATFRLFPEISVATLLDADGEELVPPVYRAQRDALAADDPLEIGRHDLVSDARLARLRESLPRAGEPGRAIVGDPYVVEDAGAAVVPMTIASAWGDGLALGVELSLASVAARMEAGVGSEREVMLLTRDGTVLLRAGRGGLVEPDRFRGLLSTASAGLQYTSVWDVDVLAASARVPDRDWVVAVAEPADAVARGIYAIQTRTGYIGGFAVLFAVVAGVLLSRSITGPVLRIREAAIAVGQGDLARRVVADGQDELAELAGAFNRMSESLERNEHELRAKNAEIEAFNRELQQRVEQRTAQLREAQARLVQSGQLAAVAEMSAGLAHELNNPLAGILGLVQIVKARGEGGGLLDSAEREVLRCKEIVANLLRFTRPAGAGDARSDGEVVDLDGVLHDVLALVGGPFRDRGVNVEFVPAGEAMEVRGDPAQLGRALGQLLTSLRAVAAPGSTLRISGARAGRAVEYRFEAGGTTAEQDDWRAAGMGFWVARQVFQEHEATLEEPVGDRGGPRTWRLVAPGAH